MKLFGWQAGSTRWSHSTYIVSDSERFGDGHLEEECHDGEEEDEEANADQLWDEFEHALGQATDDEGGYDGGEEPGGEQHLVAEHQDDGGQQTELRREKKMVKPNINSPCFSVTRWELKRVF